MTTKIPLSYSSSSEVRNWLREVIPLTYSGQTYIRLYMYMYTKAFPDWQGIVYGLLMIVYALRKKWSQNGSNLEPFWKTVPLWRVEPFFLHKNNV